MTPSDPTNTTAGNNGPSASAEMPPLEPTFEEEAEAVLERAASQLRWLYERNVLLQMKSDTVDQLCSIGKPPFQYSNAGMGTRADEPSILYSIESLLRRRREAREAQQRTAQAAVAANATPDPRTTPLGF